MTNADKIVGPERRVSRAEVVLEMKVMKSGKAAGLTEVSIEVIKAS